MENVRKQKKTPWKEVPDSPSRAPGDQTKTNWKLLATETNRNISKLINQTISLVYFRQDDPEI